MNLGVGVTDNTLRKNQGLIHILLFTSVKALPAQYTGWRKSYHCLWRYTHSLTLPPNREFALVRCTEKRQNQLVSLNQNVFLTVVRYCSNSFAWCIEDLILHIKLIVKKLGSNFLGFVLPNITLHFWVSFSTPLSTLSNTKAFDDGQLACFEQHGTGYSMNTRVSSPPWKWRIDASAILRRPHCLSPPGSGWTSAWGQVCRGRTASWCSLNRIVVAYNNSNKMNNKFNNNK